MCRLLIRCFSKLETWISNVFFSTKQVSWNDPGVVRKLRFTIAVYYWRDASVPSAPMLYCPPLITSLIMSSAVGMQTTWSMIPLRQVQLSHRTVIDTGYLTSHRYLRTIPSITGQLVLLNRTTQHEIGCWPDGIKWTLTLTEWQCDGGSDNDIIM